MKKAIFLFFLLISSFSFGQLEGKLSAFDAFDSNIGATIKIVKSTDYTIKLSGDSGKLEQIIWNVSDETLKIRSGMADIDYGQVHVIIHTPNIDSVKLTNGGSLHMDDAFSKMEHFQVSAVDNALVDLSNIDFRNLTATATDGGHILYGSTRNLVSTTTDAGEVRRTEGIN